MEKKLEKALALYENGNYKEAFDTAREIASNSASVPARVLMAKSFLNRISSPFDKQARDLFDRTVKIAFESAGSIEEVWQIAQELADTMRIWTTRVYRDHLNELVENPDFTLAKKCDEVVIECLRMKSSVNMAAKYCTLADQYREEHNLTMREYADFVDAKEDREQDGIHEEMRVSMELEATRKIFLAGRAACEDIAHTSAEYIQANIKRVQTLLYLSKIQANAVAHRTRVSTEMTIEGYKLYAEITQYMLNAMIYPNGRVRSLIVDDKRSDDVYELREAYEALEKLDPYFTRPPLPSVQPIQLSANSTSSGGCYVATAVYGSYDCPQVWTLRRFRDNTLATTWYGRIFIRTYYAISPTLVKWFGHTEWFKNMWKGTLDRMVGNLNAQGVENTPYNDKNW